ncbi:hypothetical protein BAUCODRAFT_190188 [Baudoinia panamericana UAMH 10762]|uniref:Phosphatidylinositol-specific phospholipase C X domain-containing protein n=1 Tax=Baudoinia panamericana (strain UAMH 10762) TaxID=717646 RepID=M2NNY6_BAUPA|nr:uncharacterized protein BAUCODRAFT_190188 [Baudoinia panamericana UAMH 10762]EMD00951.1 hypothetical protein BAUCODRAFT_190188 [Baudoinia panamericana UAMH 10762]
MRIFARLVQLAIELNIFFGLNNAIPALSPPPVTSSLPPPLTSRQQQVCNGNAAFCSRQYSNVSLIGTHDSAFVGNIIDPRVNQDRAVTDQLNAGIRFLQAQTHMKRSVLEMCHTSCAELDAGSLRTYLSTVKTWLDANPNEAVTMLLVNGDNVAASVFDAVCSATGLRDYAFVPSTSPAQLPIGDWPTYGEMIAAGTRLVMFLDAQANETAVPYILDEFTYFFETPYDTTDPDFNECTLDRPAGGSPNGRMYIVNHFLDQSIFGILIPDDGADYTTNAASGTGSIGAQAELCKSTYGRAPNFV